jgi:hypothetical protein
MAILKGVTFLDPACTKSITPRLMPAALATKVDKPALPVRPKKSRLLCPLFVSMLSPKGEKFLLSCGVCTKGGKGGMWMVDTNKGIIKLNIYHLNTQNLNIICAK